MTETKIYHIYAKDKCVMASVKEEDFRVTWNTIKGMVGLMHTSYKEDDLSYECVTVEREFDEASY